MIQSAHRRAHAAGGGAADRRLAGEFGLYSDIRLMLVREFEDKGLDRGEAVATAQAFLNRLMIALFVGARGKVGPCGAGDGIAGILEGGIGAGTRRVWDHIVKGLFAAFGAALVRSSPGPPGGSLFEEPIHELAFFPDTRGAEFFAEQGARPTFRRPGAPSGHAPRIAEAVRGAPGLNPVIGGILRLCSYGFQSQIGVDMLGHVFENYVTDLEVMLGRRAAARRREGIFYTPGYVTDYICSRTIAGYLSPSGSARDPTGLVSECAGDLAGLDARANCISVLDPACGSGAFLTGAARTLIAIHEEIARRRQHGGRKRHAGRGRITDAGIASRIIHSCIYGIDINPQSVDTARLSLLLLAADADADADAGGGSVTSGLSANVVVGNSVLAGPDQGGLDWRGVFPSVFAGKNPGFSIIIGNPPYVRQELLGDTAKRAMAVLPEGLAPPAPRTRLRIPKKSDLSAYFYHHSLGRLRKNGRLGFISADNWLRTEYGRPLRRMLLSDAEVETLVSPRFKVFPDADVNTVIVLLTRRRPNAIGYIIFANAATVSDFAENTLDVAARVSTSDLGGGDWRPRFDRLTPTPTFPTTTLGAAGRLRRGVTTGCNDFFVMPRGGAWARKLPPEYLRPLLVGSRQPRLEGGRAERYVLDMEDSKDMLAKTPQGRIAMEYMSMARR